MQSRNIDTIHIGSFIKIIIVAIIIIVKNCQLTSSSVIDISSNDASQRTKDGANTFPKGFFWGLSSTAYQIEGAWDADGKGESIWDRFSHSKDGENKSHIVDSSTGDVAANSYYQWKHDIQLLKQAGVNIYRFSISWTRLLPDGTTEKLNKAGIAHYNKFINALISAGIQPMVTLFAWDLPQSLQDDLGGWLDEQTIQTFGEYARLCFSSFGDRVKYWITINDPYSFCYQGYGKGKYPPEVSDPATGPYNCVHSLIKAHGLAYAIYNEEFRKVQNGRLSMAIHSLWQEPADPESKEDIAAAEQSSQFMFGWIAYPLFYGEYPPIMRQIIDEKSKQEKRNVSRLPNFNSEWKLIVKGSVDFLAINHYTTQLVKFSNHSSQEPGWETDSGTRRFYNPKWPSSGSKWLKVVPWGLRKALSWIKKTYNNPQVIITDNGVSDYSDDAVGTQDVQRVTYFQTYIHELLKAIQIDGCNVTGYVARSFLDSFEWTEGYTERFGVYYVNFTTPNKTRTPKMSLKALKEIFLNNGYKMNPLVVRTHLQEKAERLSINSNKIITILYLAPFALALSIYRGFKK